jgi:hypothetical protein
MKAIDSLKESANQVPVEVGKKELYLLSDICLAAGFFSILASILTWFTAKKTESEAHAERFGIFVGLWVPSFFILANRLARKAEEID